jgi:hypothetical protein
MQPELRLYLVTTLMREFMGCKDVELIWFRDEQKERQHLYSRLIQNYDPTTDNFYAEGYIEELFTAGEAEKLKDYLDEINGLEDTTTISEVPLPIQPNTAGVGSMCVGGGSDFLMMYRTPGYPLPFKVTAYFDLVGRELLDGSGIHHGYHLVVVPGVGIGAENERPARSGDGGS